MEENSLIEEIIDFNKSFSKLPEAEKEQARKDLEDLQGKTNKMIFKAHVTVKSLRRAADKLDGVWKDCKIAHAYGTTAGIVGGVLLIAGSLATGGAATPFLIAGAGFAVGGAGTTLGTSFVESAINSAEVKKAEKDLKETLDCINNVQTNVQKMLDKKEGARLLFMYCLAMHTLKLSDPVLKLLQQAMSCVSSISGVFVDAATKLCKFIGKPCSQAAGQVSTGAAVTASGLRTATSIMFLVWDTVDLGFTIRDIIRNEGSEAARILRDKADELEEVSKQ